MRRHFSQFADSTMRETAPIDDISEAIGTAARDLFSHKLKAVMLYGSYARGDYCANSDVDFMLLVDLQPSQLEVYRNAVSGIASEVSLKSDGCPLISIILQDITTYERYKESLPFFRNIAAEGIVIYAA
ncbi:MAG: nucleotidyltransferase domain-containing protein [Clostridiales bacterium]|nr:nucleotidyltransferase domain-containing protein [Clostridiales bacterium]